MTVKFDNVTPADISTPLSAANHSSDGLLMQELSLAGKICLRGDFSNASVTTAARETLGVSVEVDANTFVRNGDVSAFWLGPDERMIFVAHRLTCIRPCSEKGSVLKPVSVQRLSCSQCRTIYRSLICRCAGALLNIPGSICVKWRITVNGPRNSTVYTTDHNASVR